MNKIFTLGLLFLVSVAKSQTPADATMMKSRQFCFAVTYDQGSFDQYWEGALLRRNGTIETVSRYMMMPMVAIGVHDKINVIIGSPYVKTESDEPNGGYLQGAKGFQDISIAVKGEAFNKQIGKGKLSILGTVGYSTPLTNYLSDYRPYSIGFGANELSLRGIVQYKLDMGVYLRGASAYLWRGQTRAERDYYYNNGSYYTPWMDVPSAWTYQGVLGIRTLKDALVVEANFSRLASTTGDDIRKYNAAQPTNKVEANQIGGQVQYYFPQIKGFSLLSYYQTIINGRNTGKVSGFGAGATYAFKI